MADVMENYGGYTWATMLTESSLVTVFLYLRIPSIHMRRTWTTAHLMSFIGNALGGKSSGAKKLPAWKVFSPLDFLPFYARPEGYALPQLIPPHVCSLIMRALEEGDLDNASWVIQAIELEDSIERISTVAKEFDSLAEAEDPEHKRMLDGLQDYGS